MKVVRKLTLPPCQGKGEKKREKRCRSLSVFHCEASVSETRGGRACGLMLEIPKTGSELLPGAAPLLSVQTPVRRALPPVRLVSRWLSCRVRRLPSLKWRAERNPIEEEKLSGLRGSATALDALHAYRTPKKKMKYINDTGWRFQAGSAPFWIQNLGKWISAWRRSAKWCSDTAFGWCIL